MPDVREKLVELLNGKYDHYCDQCGVNKDSRYTENLADYLIANGVTIQRWIPVEERLPGNGEQVLAWLATPLWRGYDIVRFATCLEDVDEVDFEGQKHGGFYLYNSEYGFCEARNVTHWMPLPQPPKEDEDD